MTCWSNSEPEFRFCVQNLSQAAKFASEAKTSVSLSNVFFKVLVLRYFGQLRVVIYDITNELKQIEYHCWWPNGWVTYGSYSYLTSCYCCTTIPIAPDSGGGRACSSFSSTSPHYQPGFSIGKRQVAPLLGTLHIDWKQFRRVSSPDLVSEISVRDAGRHGT